MTIAFHQHQRGQQDHPDRPTLLFLHGFLGEGAEFLPFMEALADRAHGHHPSLSLDLPGHGRTQVLGPNFGYTMAETAVAIVELLDHLNIPEAIPIGYSLGGRLALYLALTYPDRFPKTILESASPGLATEAERSARRQADGQWAAAMLQDFEGFLDRWYAQPLFATLRQHPGFPELLAQRLQTYQQSDDLAPGLALALQGMGTGNQPSLWTALAKHEQPIVSLVGGRDAKFVLIQQKMVQICPDIKAVVIPQVGHNIHWETPSIFLTQLQCSLAY
jgi:2-succinyl-6-hydroxy-2,4-cyclohexadiene-1-carboxylate synthase